ncbi:hypothetical protein AB1Y20_001769 [Prymnesium parvum]|uniref:Uncharacterized protein n=1 Tax=Prymnesium parvum TaxID=97485 RepID=A0AB34KD19_PRYPA
MDRAAGDLAAGNEEIRGVASAGAADALFLVVSAFNDGSLHPTIYDALEPSSLFALRKPNGKARPIAVGDSLEAFAGRCILETKRPLLRDYFCSDADLDACLASDDWRSAFAAVPGDPAPPTCPDRPPPKPPPALQLAFAPAGTDLAHFALQALYESGGAIFGHDGVNTFNTISREAAADAIRACPITVDLLPAYRLKYGRLRSLRYGRQPFTSDGALVQSCLGPQQGCTWAEHFLLTAFGDPRSGSSGEYSAALRRGTSVTLLITEDVAVVDGVWERTRAEACKGYIRGPYKRSQLDALFGKNKYRAMVRFGVLQGAPALSAFPAPA